MNLKEIYRPIRGGLELVEKRLLELAWSDNPRIFETIADILSAGGKRLRPALLLLAAKARSYSGARGVDLAVAIELIHTTSLIHDDVIDNADMRRGIRSLNSQWGNKASVLAGDHLYSRAVSILTEDGDLDVVRSIARTVSKMTGSETSQSLSENDLNVTEEEYMSIIAGKTASLMSCACRVGAMLGGTGSSEIGGLGEYGLNLGMAFQLTDDLLDLVGEEETLGKPLGNDIRDGKLTLPFIRAISLADQKDREWMVDAFRSGEVDTAVLSRMGEMVAKYGGIDYTLEKARRYGAACKEGLRSLPESESRASLAMLADYVVERAC